MLVTYIKRGCRVWARSCGGRCKVVSPYVALMGMVLLGLSSYSRTHQVVVSDATSDPGIDNVNAPNYQRPTQTPDAAAVHNAIVFGRDNEHVIAFVNTVNPYNPNQDVANINPYRINVESPSIVLDTAADVTPWTLAKVGRSREQSASSLTPSTKLQELPEFTNSSKILRHVVMDTTHRKRTLWASEKTCGVHNVMFAVPGSLSLCALASFPGSGNTWARYLIEAASGILTGSIYKDQQLYISGYYGELSDWKTGTTIVQKTHDCGANHIQDFGSCGVLLLRNPYRAILAFHNYLFGGHTGYAKMSNYRRKDWSKFVHLQARHWLEMAVNWTNNANNLHVVHYENLKEDSSKSLKDILEFRNVFSDERRLDCIKSHKKFKYHRKEEYLPTNLEIFSPKLRDMIDRAIRYVDYILHKRGLQPIPLHLYEYYNGTNSKQITLIDCNGDEKESQCDERIDQMNLTNKSNKIPKKETATASNTKGNVKVYKHNKNEEVGNGDKLKESYSPTGIEKFALTKTGNAITSLGLKVINFLQEDPIKAEIKREKGIIKPNLKLDQEFGKSDVKKINNDFSIL